MASLQVAASALPAVHCRAGTWQRSPAQRTPGAGVQLRLPLSPPQLAQSWTRRPSQRRQAVKAQAAVKTGVAGPVTDATWKELVLESKVPVLVDFWAPWCGPCRMIAPLIDEIAQEYGSKIVALKLNTDESPGVATEYGIRSIPTVMVFKSGNKMDTVIGAVPKTTLVQTLDKYVD